MLCFKLLVTILLCSSAIVSCVFWGKSAMARAPAARLGSTLIYVDEEGGETDLIATAALQGRWNKWAAAFAAIAALCQSILRWITFT
jgi:hypothetical protein